MNWLLILGLGLLVVLFIVFMFAKHLVKWVINSIIGVFALLGWNVIFWGIPLAVNFWSVLLVAVGGIVGLIIVVLLHFLFGAF